VERLVELLGNPFLWKGGWKGLKGLFFNQGFFKIIGGYSQRLFKLERIMGGRFGRPFLFEDNYREGFWL